MILASDITTRVRLVTNDGGSNPRNTDPEIFAWINDCLNVILSMVPSLFAVGAPLALAAGVYQSIASLSRAVAFIAVDGYPKFDVDAMDVFRPGWPNDTQAAIQQWAPGPVGPKSFLVYPPSPAAQPVVVNYVASPPPVAALTDALAIPDNFIPMITQYCVAMTESKDDEHVNSNRAAQAKAEFAAAIKGA